MRHWKHIIIGVALCASILFAPACAEAGTTVVVDAHNPPNMYLHGGKAVGLYPILLDAVFKRMGVTVDIQAMPWKRVMQMGETGAAGVAGIYKTPERLEIFDYSDTVYNELLLIFVRKQDKFEFTNIDDLKGKTIGVILGWSYGEAFDRARAEGDLEVEEVNSDHLNFKKLHEGRVDCVISSKESAYQELASNGYENILQLEKPLLLNPTYLAFAKKSEKKTFLNDFNAALKALREDGEYKRLVREFMHSYGLQGAPLQ